MHESSAVAFQVPETVVRFEGKVQIAGWTLAYVLYAPRAVLNKHTHLDPVSLGRGLRTVVTSHGWLDNADSFGPLSCRIVQRWPGCRVLCVDLPGHGKSSHSASRCYTREDYIFAFLRFLHKLSIAEFTLLTHSLSSGLLPFLVPLLQPPMRVNALICIESFGVWRGPLQLERVRVNELFSDGFKERKLYESVEQIVASRMHVTAHKYPGNQSIAPKSARIILERNVAAVTVVESGSRQKRQKYYLRFDPVLKNGAINSVSQFALTLNSKQLVEQLLVQKLKCPVLVILAHNGWPGVGRVAETVAKRKRNVKVVTVSGSHHVHIDDPNTCMRHIAPFLSPLFASQISKL